MKVKKIAFLGLFTSAALILSFLETLIPNIVPIPGFKIGLANFAILLALYIYDYKEAIIVDLVRILLSALLFGSMFSLIYSLSGAVLALLVEIIVKKVDKFSVLGVSVLGAIFHIIGQFILAICILKSFSLLYYLPFTLIFCILTGAFNGYLVHILKDRLKKLTKNDQS